jgi:hypothetical protein
MPDLGDRTAMPWLPSSPPGEPPVTATSPDETGTAVMEEPPEPGAVLYRPINAGDPGYTGSCGQLARRRDGGWLYRGLSNCLGMEAMPSLLP